MQFERTCRKIPRDRSEFFLKQWTLMVPSQVSRATFLTDIIFKTQQQRQNVTKVNRNS